MAKYIIPAVNWTSALADTIKVACNGDEIVCANAAMAELGERARKRMCPQKILVFSISEDEEKWKCGN